MKFNFFNIAEADFEKKQANLAVTTLLSLIGLGALIVIEAVAVNKEDDEQDENNEE